MAGGLETPKFEEYARAYLKLQPWADESDVVKAYQEDFVTPQALGQWKKQASIAGEFVKGLKHGQASVLSGAMGLAEAFGVPEETAVSQAFKKRLAETGLPPGVGVTTYPSLLLDPRYYSRQLGEAIGNILAVAPAAGISTSPLFLGGLGAATEAGGTFQELREKGSTKGQARLGAAVQFPAALWLEKFMAGKALENIPALKRIAKTTGAGALTEMGEEVTGGLIAGETLGEAAKQALEVAPSAAIGGGGLAAGGILLDKTAAKGPWREGDLKFELTGADNKANYNLYAPLVDKYADSVGVPREIAQRLVNIESKYNQAALSKRGAIGLTQLMPTTAKELGVNPFDPEENIRGGLTYLRQQFDKFGNWEDALRAYNAGPSAARADDKVSEGYAKAILGSGQVDITKPAAPGKNIVMGKNANFNGFSPALVDNINKLADAYYDLTGEKLHITSAARTREEQQKLWDNRAQNPYPVAKPGKSRHERAGAFDIDSRQAKKLEDSGLLKKYGFHRPYPNDPVHIEPIAGQPLLQPRMRNRAQSVAQMNEIAEDPDFDLLNFSPTMETGAPVVAVEYETEIPVFWGKQLSVTLPNGKKILGRWALMGADDIATSHDIQGRPIPEYINAPAQAVTNGRMRGISEAYNRNTAGKYLTDLEAKANLFGFSLDQVSKIKKPVLVRKISPRDAAKYDVGRQSNIPSVLAMSAPEQAMMDAERISLDNFTPNEQGTVLTPENRGFVQDFVNYLTQSERGQYLDANNQPTQALDSRLRNAIFAKAYGDANLVTQVVENPTPEGVTRIRTLQNVAGSVASLSGDIADMVRSAVSDAMNELAEGSRRGLSAHQVASQHPLAPRSPLADAMINLFADNPRSSKAQSAALSGMLHTMQQDERHEAQGDMFGDVVKRTEEDYANMLKPPPGPLSLQERISLLQELVDCLS